MYTNNVSDIGSVLYSGFTEELVDVLQVKDNSLVVRYKVGFGLPTKKDLKAQPVNHIYDVLAILKRQFSHSTCLLHLYF